MIAFGMSGLRATDRGLQLSENYKSNNDTY